MLNRVTRTVNGQLLTVQEDLARIDAIGSKDCARNFRPACAYESGKAQDFAAPQLKAHVSHESAAVEVADLEHHILARVLRHLRRGFIDRAADHHRDDSLDRRFVSRHRIDVATITHDSHAVGDLLQLLQPVRDVHDADTLAAELANDVEQGVNFGIRQRRGRLVHDQHFGIQ